MELGLSFFSAKDEEVDNVSNLSCQPPRVAAPLTCQGGRISCEPSRGKNFCVQWALLDPS